jgi:hypothetical protein
MGSGILILNDKSVAVGNVVLTLADRQSLAGGVVLL